MLLDEPITRLDPGITEQLLIVISEQKRQKGIVLSDHSYANVLLASANIYLIIAGGRSVLLKDPEKELKLFGYIN